MHPTRTDSLVRSMPIGAEVLPGAGGVSFRVWAPKRQSVEVVLGPDFERTRFALENEGDGYFSAIVEQAKPGTLYRFALDGGKSFPDPASRFQPEGPHGPSQVVSANQFPWTDHDWPGSELKGQVIYELHVGTFTPEGTWRAAAAKLPTLAETGITLIEMMPVGDFAGKFGWGYDGVDLFAPTHLYGSPDDLRAFIDAAHRHEMGVILDVVYNHLGPDGCYLSEFSPAYFTDRYDNEWGEAINFDGPDAGPVREFFTANAAYWIREFHFDGLRLDATQQIFDASPRHILQEISESVREAANGRSTVIIAENEPQHTSLVRPIEQGGYGLDALWNDDFHHSAVVALTGKREAYYTDYPGKPQEFISAIKWGYLYQGQRYKWQKKRRGTPALDLEPARFVTFIENHDQVANSDSGRRLHQLSSPGRYRALTCLMLLAPGTPMLFQGQEFMSSARFLYFAHHKPELAAAIRKGRTEFLSQFRSIATPEVTSRLIDPTAATTFQRCKLDWSERERNREAVALHQDLLRLRREDPVFNQQARVDGAVLGADTFLLRYFANGYQDRLLLVNYGRHLQLDPAPEPLLAPPAGMEWRLLWSSEDPRYGGSGTPALESDGNWSIPGETAVVLAAQPLGEHLE